MTGFEFIAKAFKASYTDIAKQLNITTSTVADWASGRRPISKDKIPLVSNLFRVDEEYFKKKELSEVEKIKIEINYLERASKRDSFQLEDTIIDDGKEIEVYSWYNPHEGDLRYKYEELAYEELYVRLKQILNYDFHLDIQFHRTKNHFQVVTQLVDLLEKDEGKQEIEEYEDITKEELLSRKQISTRVDAISRMLYFLNGGKLLAFGKIDDFDQELFMLLRKFEIIETEPPKKLEKFDDPFDHVDPKYVHE